MKSRILYEDNNIIVVHKPAGIATQTARVGQRDMVSEVKGYLACKEQGTALPQAKRNGLQTPYVGLIHRLDQPVEGILVFAKDKQSAAALSKQMTDDRMEKYYYAVVCGQDFPDKGELADYLIKDGKTNTSRIVPKEVKGAKPAKLSYEILRRQPAGMPDEGEKQIALAKIHLQTGRHHQIRVQMRGAGMSLLGDYKYADEEAVRLSERMKIKEIALCAYRLEFEHPWARRKMQFQITPEGKSFSAFSFVKDEKIAMQESAGRLSFSE